MNIFNKKYCLFFLLFFGYCEIIFFHYMYNIENTVFNCFSNQIYFHFFLVFITNQIFFHTNDIEKALDENKFVRLYSLMSALAYDKVLNNALMHKLSLGNIFQTILWIFFKIYMHSRTCLFHILNNIPL